MLVDRIIGAFTFRPGVYSEVEEDSTFTKTAWIIVAVVAFLNQLGSQATSDLARWLSSEDAARLHPVERAVLAHFRLVHVHPFIDGNGRTARLLMNLILMRQGYPPAIVRVDERPSYYDTLDAAHAGDTGPFIQLIAQAVDRSLDVWLATAGGQVNG